MNANKVHSGSIDLLRVVAMLSVIAIHTVSGPLAQYQGNDAELKQILQTIVNIMMWAVPVFFMITGYCAGLRETLTFSYSLRKVKKYVIVLFTIGLFYAFLERFFNTRSINLQTIGGAILDVINGNSWGHMWFVYSIIGVYLVLPMLFMFMKNSGEQIISLSILFAFSIFLPWLCAKTDLNVDVDFQLGGYSFFACFGMVFSTHKFQFPDRKIIIAAGAAAIAAGIIPIILGVTPVWYTDLVVCMMSMGAFAVFENLQIKSTDILKTLAACTWGVYLIHPFFINLAVKFFKINFLTGAVAAKLLILYIITTILSFLCVFILRKIPVIRELF